MTWKITYYNDDLEDKILELPASLLARYINLTELMKEHGADIGMPHTKALGKSLFELRLKGKEGIARVFYCTMVGKTIYMLHCFVKKTEETPKKEMRLARKRLKEIKEDV
jgi:phage-related protein